MIEIRSTEEVSAPEEYETGHIGVLDGIRAVAILIIVWFHFWQQSWLIPVAGPINLDWLPRNGAIAVDLLVLLSGFCLFLPYARSMVYEEEVPDTKSFYIRRAARIMPSYYVYLFIVLFLFALPLGEYANIADMLKDLVPHIVFLNNWFAVSNQGTHLGGVLWTVAVLVQYYALFPLLARAFQKKPMITYWCMTGVGLLSCFLIGRNFYEIDQNLFLNNTLTFAGVYANGMLGAWVYVAMTKDRERNRAEGVFFTAVALACIWLYKIMCDHRMSYGLETKWQVDYRYLLSLLFLTFIISTIMSARWFRAIWDNRVMRFLAAISFNLYLCHQYVSVKLKDLRIPPWEGDVPPNQLGDKVWQWEYFALCILISLVVAVAMTFLIERPIAKFILKRTSANGETS